MIYQHKIDGKTYTIKKDYGYLCSVYGEEYYPIGWKKLNVYIVKKENLIPTQLF